ncbi:MAG: hypothetical protein V1712_02555 [Patescibacteria group bacterium]
MIFGKKNWLFTILIVIAALSIFLIVLNNSSRSVNSSPIAFIDDYEQQQSNYLNNTKIQLDLLKPYLEKELETSNTPALSTIKDDLIKLRVPVGYQNFHLALVLKISLLSELLAGKEVNNKTKLSLVSAQGDLKAQIDKFDDLVKVAALRVAGTKDNK